MLLLIAQALSTSFSQMVLSPFFYFENLIFACAVVAVIVALHIVYQWTHFG